jgi:hypothetical protein
MSPRSHAIPPMEQPPARRDRRARLPRALPGPRGRVEALQGTDDLPEPPDALRPVQQHQGPVPGRRLPPRPHGAVVRRPDRGDTDVKGRRRSTPAPHPSTRSSTHRCPTRTGTVDDGKCVATVIPSGGDEHADDELRDAECSMEQCYCARFRWSPRCRGSPVSSVTNSAVVGLPLVNRLQVARSAAARRGAEPRGASLPHRGRTDSAGAPARDCRAVDTTGSPGFVATRDAARGRWRP